MLHPVSILFMLPTCMWILWHIVLHSAQHALQIMSRALHSLNEVSSTDQQASYRLQALTMGSRRWLASCSQSCGGTPSCPCSLRALGSSQSTTT